MPDLQKLEAARAARAGRYFDIPLKTRQDIRACEEENGGEEACDWKLWIEPDPDSGVEIGFIQVVCKSTGKVYGTFNLINPCPPFC